jgi:hypothetical protein
MHVCLDEDGILSQVIHKLCCKANLAWLVVRSGTELHRVRYELAFIRSIAEEWKRRTHGVGPSYAVAVAWALPAVLQCEELR